MVGAGLITDAARAAFASAKLLRLPGLIDRERAAAARDYFRGEVQTGRAKYDDGQPGAMRFYRHNDPTIRAMHEEFAGLVSDVAGVAVKPSYSYWIAYDTPGRGLAPHTDRAQCEYTLNVGLDNIPEGPASWPLCIRGVTGETVEVRLDPGDALLYKGCELFHWRAPLPSRTRFQSILFHYVHAAFNGRLT